jgi:hypothetical protein
MVSRLVLMHSPVGLAEKEGEGELGTATFGKEAGQRCPLFALNKVT